MKILIMFVLITFAATGRVFGQIPAEWQAAAQAVIADLERDFVALCRQGCAGNTIEGKGYIAVAEQAKNLKAQNGGPYGVVTNTNAWLAAVSDPTGAAAKNAAMWSKDPDVAAADFATGNLYALYWLLAQARPTPTEQANSFARFAIFVQGKAWIGTRCLDITKVALVIGAPPRVENCK